MNKLIAPSTDFRAVRDGRNSQVFYVDIALGTARSAAAGTGLVLPISGNSFYCDANPSDGNAFVHFQDTNFDRGPVPLYVSPGVIFNIPYTQVLIENSAQPGKKIRIAYGIDVDFQPGSVAQIAVTNNGGFTAVRPESASSTFINRAALSANTPITVFTPAANVNGAVLLNAEIGDFDTTSNISDSLFIAKSGVAPTSVSDGDPIMSSRWISAYSTTNIISGNTLTVPQLITAGQGLYFIRTTALGVAVNNFRTARYRLL